MGCRGIDYDARFARLEGEGRYLHGEADLVDRLLGGPPATVLDAGCGTGRIAVELARRGYRTHGVDVDPEMLAAARAKAPEASWELADLSDLQRDDLGADLVLAAGNVVLFLRPGILLAVLANMRRALRPGGLLVAGFRLGPTLPLGATLGDGPGAHLVNLAAYDDACNEAGFELVNRWGTWEGEAFRGGDYAVTVHRCTPTRSADLGP